MAMSSSRPYLVRALYEWIMDNQCTPHLLVDAHWPGTSVPQEYVQNGQIVLNISSSAVMDLHITNDCISFRGRFGGVPRDIMVPSGAVLGIYARENGQGMIFEQSEQPPPPDTDVSTTNDDNDIDPDPPTSSPTNSGGKPSLRVVK